MPTNSGPYVQAALLCENVIQDVTGVLSLIRVIDTIDRTGMGPNPPIEMEMFVLQLKMVIMLKSGDARGRFEIKIVPHLPTGESKEPILLTVHFEGEEKGHNMVLDIQFPIQHEGVHWFKVSLEDELITSIPLRVKYNRQVTLVGPQSG